MVETSGASGPALGARRDSAFQKMVLRIAILSSDTAALFTAFFLSGWVSALVRSALAVQTDHDPLSRPEVVLSRGMVFILLSTVLLIWLASRGHYRQRHSFWFEMQDIVVVCMIAALVDAFLQYAAKEDFSRLWLTTGWAFAAVLIPAYRAAMRAGLSGLRLWQMPVLVLGSEHRCDEIRSTLEADRALGYRVVASAALGDIVDPSEPWAATDAELLDRLVATGLGHGVHVVLAPDHTELPLIDRLAELMERHTMSYAIAAPLAGIPLNGLEPQYFIGSNVLLLTIRNNLERPVNRTLKRLFDIVVASIVAVLLSPVMLAVALLVRLDGGPVFYGHSRVGWHGERFRCWKFRSMVVDADQRLKQLLDSDPEARREWDKDFKLRKDPRVTWLGGFLRVSGLDELPQLVNVLLGQMSLVGPRPIVDGEIERYGSKVSAYYAVRPGITGLWQVSGRNDVDYATRVAFDLWYARNWSLWLDLVVMLKTIPAVLARRGAY